MIPSTYFAYWTHSRHLNHVISEILVQRNVWIEVAAIFVYQKHTNKFENLQPSTSNLGVKVCLTAVKLQMFGYQACHVCTQLEHVFLSRVLALVKTTVNGYGHPVMVKEQ